MKMSEYYHKSMADPAFQKLIETIPDCINTYLKESQLEEIMKISCLQSFLSQALIKIAFAYKMSHEDCVKCFEKTSRLVYHELESKKPPS